MVVDEISVEGLITISEKIRTFTDTMISTKIAGLLSGFSLKRFEIHVWSYKKPEISTTTLTALRHVADKMFKLGVEMEVYGMTKWRRYGHQTTLLVERGFTTQLP